MTNQQSTLLSHSRVLTSCADVYEATIEARASGKTIGLVPTMGALHAGHLSLVHACNQECTYTVVTIFVNPKQFGPNEDFSEYPRTLHADREALEKYNVDILFVPKNADVYPDGFSTYVDPPDVARRWEGECRPGHLRGVSTVVLKLFNMIPADFAYFGQKDYQQSLVIRRMVKDLNLPVTIRTCPIIREPDGLALSSRNSYLSVEERKQALALSQSLELANNLVEHGEQDANEIKDQMRGLLNDAAISTIDYVVLADPETLEGVKRVTGPTIALVAAHVGQTRLIDNRQIG